MEWEFPDVSSGDWIELQKFFEGETNLRLIISNTAGSDKIQRKFLCCIFASLSNRSDLYASL